MIMPVVNSRPCFLTPKPPKPDYPLFIFLPGMDGTGQLLRSQIGFLEAAFDIRSLAISPADLTGWDELAQQVGQLIAAEVNKGHKRMVYLCGESFGGCLAMKVMQQIPQLIDRLILINPASSFRRQPLLTLGSCLVHWIPEGIYSTSTGILIPFLAATERLSHDVLQQLQETLQIVPQTTTNWRLCLLREFHITEAQLKAIVQPTLVIAGAADRLLPSVSEARHLVSILPNAQMAVLPDSGHACLLERDVDLFKLLRSQKFIEMPGVQLARESAMIIDPVGH
jgi:pimeloyl-ACP methyl ester carboxylesterase